MPLCPTWAGCELELRGDDHAMVSSVSLFEVRRNDGIIYRALLEMAMTTGRGFGTNNWSIRVGYTALRLATGCSTRALGRAWPRLQELGFLKSREAPQGRRSARYILRSIESVDEIYASVGYTHYRVMPNGKLQPFRPKPHAGRGAR
jgi:hypothetical protein